MTQDRPLVIDGLRAVGRELGYEVTAEREKERSHVERLRYTDINGHQNQIRHEVNFLERLRLSGIERRIRGRGLQQVQTDRSASTKNATEFILKG